VKLLLNPTQAIEYPFREVEKVVSRKWFEAGGLEEPQSRLCGEEFRICVHGTSSNDRLRDRIPWVVFDDATQATWREHSLYFIGKKCS
jgi:hypothetical protein